MSTNGFIATDCSQTVKSLNVCADPSWVYFTFDAGNTDSVCCLPGWEGQQGSGRGSSSFCQPSDNVTDPCTSVKTITPAYPPTPTRPATRITQSPPTAIATGTAIDTATATATGGSGKTSTVTVSVGVKLSPGGIAGISLGSIIVSVGATYSIYVLIKKRKKPGLPGYPAQPPTVTGITVTGPMKGPPPSYAQY